jgi:hypothetical protein
VGVLSFVPEVWSPILLQSLKRAEVYGMVVNRNYEGEIAQKGDTVHINSVSRPTINSYTTYATITVEQLTTADRTLVINKADYFAFSLDDLDKRQAAGNVVETAMGEAGYGLRDKVDQLIAGLYVDTQTANRVNAGTAVSCTTGAICYTQLTKLKQKLDEANVPQEGRWVVVPPWYVALLLDTANFVANPASNTQSALVTGQIGRAAGMDILVSNNVPIITANQYAVMAGVVDAISFAEQINELEAYRLQTSFADAVRGLHLYGAKTVRPDAIAYVNASTV